MQEERKEVPAWYRRESLQEDRDSFQVEYTVHRTVTQRNRREGSVWGAQVVMSAHAGY